MDVDVGEMINPCNEGVDVDVDVDEDLKSHRTPVICLPLNVDVMGTNVAADVDVALDISDVTIKY